MHLASRDYRKAADFHLCEKQENFNNTIKKSQNLTSDLIHKHYFSTVIISDDAYIQFNNTSEDTYILFHTIYEDA